MNIIATGYIYNHYLCHIFAYDNLSFSEVIAPNKLEQFRRVRATYTHLAIWTNVPRGADRLYDTIFLKNVTLLESDRKGFGASFYKIIRLYFYVFMC